MLRDRYGPDRIDPPAHDENAKTPVIHILGYDAAGEPIVTQPRTNWRSITKPVAAWQRQSINVELSLSQIFHGFYPLSIFAAFHVVIAMTCAGKNISDLGGQPRRFGD